MRRLLLLPLAAAALVAAAPWQPPAATIGSDSGAVQVGKASLGLVAFAVDGGACASPTG